MKGNHVRWWVCGVTLILACAAPAQVPDLSKMDLIEQSIPDGPIAKVNGVNIDREEFLNLYHGELMGIAARLGAGSVKEIPDRARIQAGMHAIHLLVEHELLYQQAVARKLTVTDAEIQEQWSAAMEAMKDRFARGGDASSAQGALSEDEILKRAGMTRERALESLRKGALVRKMREQIVKDQGAAVTDAELSKFFDEHKDAFKQPEQLHLQQIYIRTRAGGAPFDDKKKAQARERVETALKRIQAGESFEAVAKAMSESPDKDKGGDMGTVAIQGLPPFFVEPAAKMKPGEVSAVIESELGFHIFKLLEAVAPGEASLDKAKPFIERLLLADKTDRAVDAFCRPLAEKPDAIEVYLQIDRTLAARPDLKDLRDELAKDKEAGAEAAKPAATKPAAKGAAPKKAKATPAKPKAKKAVKKTGAN